MRRYFGAGVIAACGGLAGQVHADGLAVATDIAPVHSLVAMVMGDVGTPSLIVPQSASPHDHSMRPSEARALDDADVVIWIGGELTPWMQNAVSTLADDARVLTLMDDPATRTLPFREGATFEAHDHDHGHEDGHEEDHADEHKDDHVEGHDEDHAEEHKEEHHDEHAEGQDPHIWLDPENAMRWLPRIAEVLAEIDPAHEGAYQKNAAQAVAALQSQVTEIKQDFAAVRDKPFVVFHDAYHYFEARFDVEATGSIAASDAEAPSPKRLREIQKTIQDTGAKCVFAEPQQRRDWVDAVAPHAKVGQLDPLGFDLALGPDLYTGLLNNLATSLRDCLEG